MPAAAGAVRRHTCSARAGARQPVSTWKSTQSKTRARGIRSLVSSSAASTRPATGWTGSMTSSRCSTCSMTWRITPARLPPWPRPRCQAPGWRSSTTSTAATVRQARWPTRTARLCPIPSSGRMSRAPWGRRLAAGEPAGDRCRLQCAGTSPSPERSRPSARRSKDVAGPDGYALVHEFYSGLLDRLRDGRLGGAIILGRRPA